jgi:tetratricopeptide (TPR) repeat protein
VLTWRRSLQAGALAFGALVVGTTVFMLMRQFGVGPVGTLLAQGVIGEGQRVVLADFASPAADAALGGVVTEALRIDLQQSDVLRPEDPARLRPALERMQRAAADGLPEPVALELAVREGYRAVIAGEVAPLGGAWVLTARVVRADSGTAVASFKSVARDSTQLIEAVEELSREIRAKAGESLREVRAAPPLAQVTTTSLAALRRYSDALRLVDREADYLRSLPLLEEAVALDSTFGMAWRRLGANFVNLGLRAADRDHALRRAYALRERMTEKEAQLATAAYHSWIEVDTDRVIDAYRKVLELDPGDRIASNNLAAALVGERRYAEAEAIIARVPEPDRLTTHWGNLLQAQAGQGKLAEARATLARARAVLPKAGSWMLYQVEFAYAEGHAELADSIAASELEKLPDNRFARVMGSLQRLQALRVAGRLREAQRWGRDLTHLALQAELPAVPLLIGIAETESLIQLGSLEEARRALRATLSEWPLDSLPAEDREYPWLAVLHARLGEHDRAAALLAAYHEADPNWRDDPDAQWAAASLQLGRGDAAGALPALQRLGAGWDCELCALPELAAAYEQLGQPDSVLAVLERYLAFPSLERSGMDATHLGSTLFRAAQLHEQAGNRERAMERYAALTRLWSRADPAYQPTVRAAQERLQALRGRG